VTTPLPDELSGQPARSPEDRAQPLEDTVWHRLHPLSPLVRAGRQLLSVLVLLFGISVLNEHQESGNLIADLVIIAVALAGGFISWLVTRWQVEGGVLRIDTGLLRRESRRIPLSQVQAVDVVQTGLARVLGLAELQLRVAGGDSARGGRLACLRRGDAERLRRELLAMAAASHGTGIVGAVPAPGLASGPGAATEPGMAAGSGQPVLGGSRTATPGLPPGRVLFRVSPLRLAVAIAASRAGGIAVLAAGATVAAVELSGSTRTVEPFLPVLLGVAAGLWRQFNGAYGTTIMAAYDGIQLRSGLIQTTAETIWPGRIQAVRVAEPLIWRAFGWCRLDVDVAGVRQRRENQSEGQRLRALIPVGCRADAEQMLSELLVSRPRPSRPAPRRVRWKAPLSYHFLGWGSDDRYLVASRGRICRQTTWVPLEKVQSIRWVQGPLQRRLGLATVHLDVAGRRVSAKIEDRDSSEALEIMSRLPDLARAARSGAS
jgi:putative membrane protein